MSDTSTRDFYTRQAEEARGPESQGPPKRRRRRLRTIAIASGVSLVMLAGAVVGGGYLFVNNLAGSVHRIPGILALDAKDQPAQRSGSMNVLFTDTGVVPDENRVTGFVELMHLNAGEHSGAVISFPADTVVPVPGFGRREIAETLELGGPSLMIETLERLTDVRIDHYSAIAFSGLPRVVGAMNGVEVNVPYTTTSFGFTFHAGVNELNTANVLAYVRQPGVSEVGRMELQENLLRTILAKIASRRFFRHAMVNYRVLHAVVDALSVDSNFSNTELESLALHLGALRGRDGVSIDVPTTGTPRKGDFQPVYLRRKLSRELWRAIRDDSVAAFARRHPSTVTPDAPA